jgi:hypothetical protein
LPAGAIATLAFVGFSDTLLAELENDSAKAGLVRQVRKSLW